MPAPLTFGGNESFSAPPEQVFATLTDLERLPRIIPDLISSEKVDNRTLNCVVRPGFSFLRGTLRMTITIVELKPPESASMKVTAAGIGADRSGQRAGNHGGGFRQRTRLVGKCHGTQGPRGDD